MSPTVPYTSTVKSSASFGCSCKYSPIAGLANPAIGEYLQEHPKLADDFTVEVYGTVGDKCLEVMKGTGVPFKVFQSKLGYSRL